MKHKFYQLLWELALNSQKIFRKSKICWYNKFAACEQSQKIENSRQYECVFKAKSNSPLIRETRIKMKLTNGSNRNTVLLMPNFDRSRSLK